MFKKISFGQNGTKNVLFLLSQAQTRHSLTFKLRFLHELKHEVRFPKTAWDFPFSIPFCFYYIVYVFVLQIAWTL